MLRFLIPLLICVGWAFAAPKETRLYEILEVKPTATKEEIKKSFRSLAIKWHPDKHKAEAKADADERMRKITYAYSILSDMEKRKTYDRHGERGLEHNGSEQSGGFDFHSFMKNFFGQDSKPIPDLVFPLRVSLETIFKGGELSFDFVKQIVCPSCNGSGASDPNALANCSKCQGQGVVVHIRNFGMFYQHIQERCEDCKGRGKICKSVCKACKGGQMVQGTRLVKVCVPMGAPEGHSIVILLSVIFLLDSLPRGD